MILLPPDTFFDPAPNIPSTSNAPPSGVHRTEIGSQESPNPSSPGHNDLSFSSESEDNSDASKSEDDSDDSSPDSSPLCQQHREHTYASLFEGANSSLSNTFYLPSVTGSNIELFVQVEDPT
ncbi:hypothetical protein Dimus_003940, partial [Dionaea muscipula]